MRNLLFAAIILFAATASHVAAGTTDKLDLTLVEAVEPLSEDTSAQAAIDDVTLVQFWASWCHSCGSLMWDMDDLVSRNPGLGYVAISIDDRAEDAFAYLQKHALYSRHPGRYFIDREKALVEQLDIQSVPSIFLIDSEGSILVQKTGHLNSSDLQDFAKAINENL